MEEAHIYLHALRSIPSITDKSLRKILGCFDFDTKKAWESTTLPSGIRLSPVLEIAWKERHTIVTNPTAHSKILEEQNIRLILETDSEYPPLLKEITDCPYFLYVRGTLPLPNMPLLAVVGSRRFTSYGKQVCVSLVRDLTRAGIGIVSGLAFGIDKIAHSAALDEGTSTWAVLGSGVDDKGITPTSHEALGKEIVLQGALISEFPPGSTPEPRNFPQRNRIVAGMTLGTLVIEAAEKSGSLITARLALEYDREVFAVPGSIFSSLCQGTNELLKKGAFPVTNAQDILTQLVPSFQTNTPGSTSKEKQFSQLNTLETKIVQLLSYEALHIDEITKKTGVSIAEVSSTLMMLEIKKYTKHIGNQQYILTPGTLF